MDECVSMSTPMATKRLDADLQGTPTDQTTYRLMIGRIMYLTTSPPDIAFVTFVCARYQARPTVKHLKEVKRIFRYLRQSYNKGLWYLKDSGFELITYSDADHAECKDDCKTEAEYVSLSACFSQGIWMRTQLLDTGYKYNRIPMYFDSKSAIAISCNLVQHSRTKHIDIRPGDAHQDELCPPNKRYALMNANKKVDLKNPLCPYESRILENILQNHPLRFNIATSSLVPWIYLGLFLHTLVEYGSKYKLKFMLDRKGLTMNLDDFRTIFHLPQATDNNHDHFVPAPKFSEMVPFYVNNLGFTLELRSTSNYKTTGLLQPWTTSAPRTPNPETAEEESINNKEDDLFLQDTIQVSLAEQKSLEELEAIQNVEKVKEQLMTAEIKKLVEGSKNVEENVKADSSPVRNDDNQTNLDTRLKPMRDKESPEVENIAEISQPLNVIKEEEESAEYDYELKQREKENHVDEIRNTSSPTTVRSPRIQSTIFVPKRKFNVLAKNIEVIMMELLPKLVDDRIKGIIKTQVPLHVAQGLILEREKSQADVAKMIADAIQQEHKNLRTEISSQVNDAIANHIPSQVDSSVRSYITGPEKIVLSLHKFLAVIFPDDDIKERISDGANGSIVSITKPDNKNLNENDIEDMYLLIVNHKERVHNFQLGVESYQQQVNLTAPTLTFLSIKKYNMFSIISKLVYGIIYENIKKEKRVMRHQEVHKFCDATLKRVLEGLKSYKNDIKYGYVTSNLSKDDVEYLQLFVEEIEDQLKHQDQMRRCEIYMNRRPLGSSRERPE
uniref:Retrovirus-related Pol polyprotein from transposon TNT 1-94 n=1 Tax=Tanacetum cinerariifolium TaxID=118510 RepID=A0A6L2L790_TANCI|nr:hypothetical protein [Tanacetum cinerariifolium]